MRAVILAAGKGTRMMPLTKCRPKMMIPILNRPILEHIVVGLRDAGVDEFVFITGHLGEQIQAWFGSGEPLGVRVDYIPQDVSQDARYGTAIGAAMAREFVGDEPFVLTFGDIMTPATNYSRLVRAYQESPESAFICVNEVRDLTSGGAVFVEDGHVVDIIEKPPAGTVKTNLINSGIFVLRPEIFTAIDDLEPSARGEYELTTALVDTIREGIPTRAHALNGYWSNVGAPDEVMWLTQLLLQRMAAAHRENGDTKGLLAQCRGPVFLGQDVSIARGATITGPVFIGDGCRIGKAHVGRYTTLGTGCQVRDGAHVVTSSLFSNTTLCENSHVGHALVGSGVTVDSDAWLVGTSDHTAVVEDNGIVA